MLAFRKNAIWKICNVLVVLSLMMGPHTSTLLAVKAGAPQGAISQRESATSRSWESNGPAQGPRLPGMGPAALASGGTCAQTRAMGNERIAARSELTGETLEAGPGLSIRPGDGAALYDGAALSTRSRGLAPDAALSYDSLYRQDDAGWGYGWTFSYDWRYEIEENGVVLWQQRSGLFFESDTLGGFISPSSSITMTRQGDSLIVDWAGGRRLFFDSPVHKKVTRWEQNDDPILTFAYNGAGQLQAIQSDNDQRIDVTFQDGRLHTLTDASVTPARQLQLDYNAAGDLTAVTAGPDRVTTLFYDAGHRLVGVTDPQGAATSLVYNGEYVTQFTRGDVTTFWTIDEEANTVTVTEETPGQPPRRWIYAYNYQGLLESATYPDGATTRQVWDEVLGEWRSTDANGHTTALILAGNRMTASRDPLGNTTTYTYSPTTEQMTGIIDPNGHMMAYDYDETGHITAMTDPQGGRWGFEYNADGQITRTTDPLSRTTEMEHDDRGYPTVMTDALGIPSSMTYDAAGRLTATTDGNGHTNRIGYDGLDRPTVMTDALGYTITLVYDGGDSPVQATDPNGNSIWTVYDAEGRARVVTDALGNAVRMGYDGWGNLAELTDERGYTTTYRYDERDRLVAETNPLGQMTRYRYDAAGNRAGVTDARGQVITQTYDADNRPIAVDYAGSDDDGYTFYDPAGQATVAGDADVEIQSEYNAAGRVLTASYTYAGAPFAPLSVGHSYNLAGQVTTATLPGGETAAYTYNPVGLLSEIAGHGTRHTLVYDAGRRLTQITPPAGSPGARSSYGYDAADRITALTNANADGSVVFDAFTYAYDPAGNVLTATRNGAVAGYSYDAAYRLTGVSDAGGWEHYTYDAAGNRLTRETPGGTARYQYDAANQLAVLTDTTGIATAFAYDANGNMTRRTRQGQAIAAYTWDAANRLARIDYPDGTFLAYTYGPDGQRLSRRGRDGALTYYVYDGLNLVEERDAAGNLLASYVYGGDLDRPYSMKRGGQVYYYLYDRQGSVVGLSDGAGALVARYEYDAWGYLLSETSAVENPFRYTGREWDAEAELYYLRARYYDPALGRFISRDPLGMVDGTNRYSYVSNNAVNYVDAQGTHKTKYSDRYQGEDGKCGAFCDIFLPCFNEHMDAAISDIDAGIKMIFDFAQIGVLSGKVSEMVSTLVMNLMSKLNFPQPGLVNCLFEATKQVISIASLISALIGMDAALSAACASTPATGVGAAACAVVVTTIVLTFEEALHTLNAGLECAPEAFDFEDTEPPVATTSLPVESCAPFRRVTVTDNCGVDEIWDNYGKHKIPGAPITWSDLYFEKWFTQWVYGRDKAKNTSNTVYIPACRQECHPAPDCGCEAAYWDQKECRWKCPEDSQTPSCPPCTEPKLENCTWSCVAIQSNPPRCGVDRCGNPLSAVKDPETCKWKCLTIKPNNPCIPDDNRSPAGLQITTPTATCQNTNASASEADSYVAILDNGFAIPLQDVLTQLGITAKRVEANFSPEIATRYPVLVIPSGGLNGYAGSEAMRLRLARYVENGGTLIAFAQVYGNEFGLLPGGALHGYGWDEDINCHSNSATISTFAPMVAGQYRDLLSLNIDGFFTAWPTNTEVILGRVANGMPVMLAYPYGAGRVIATTTYADMAHYQGQGTTDERILVRDLLSWARTPDMDINSYGPTDQVTVVLTATNRTTGTLSQLHYYFFNAQRIQVGNPGVVTLAAPLAPGASTPVSFTLNLGALNLPREQLYGLWSVNIAWMDETGTAVQQDLRAYRFAVTRFTKQANGGHGYQGAPYALSATSESEVYPHGSSATFTYNVFNHSDQEETFKVHWWMPHHSWSGVPGYTGSEMITVTAHSMGSVTNNLERIVDLDRVRARLYLNDREVAYAERGFWAVTPQISASLVANKKHYYWRDKPVITVTLASSYAAPISATVSFDLQKPTGQVDLLDARIVTISSGNPYVYALNLPMLDAATYNVGYNRFLLTVETHPDSERSAFKTPTGIYLSPRLVNAQVILPGVLETGAPLTVTVSNVSDGLILTPTVALSMTNPAGETIWSGQQLLPDLNPGQQVAQMFMLGDIDPVVIGDYHLVGSVVDPELTLDTIHLKLPASASLGVQSDREFYRIRETVQMTATARNQGYFDMAPTLGVAAPDIGYSATQTLTLPMGAEAVIPITITLPATLTPGIHTVQIAMQQGKAIVKTFRFYQPPVEIDISVGQSVYTVGQSLPMTLTNIGGEDTLIVYNLKLRDIHNNELVLAQANDVPLLAGQSLIIGGSLPTTLASGNYRLELSAHNSGRIALERTWQVDIRGTDVQAQFSGEMYTGGDIVPVTLVNHGVADATVVYTLTLYDRNRGLLAGQNLTGVSVPAGATVVVTGTVPQEIKSGRYNLFFDGVSENRLVRLIKSLQIEGITVDMTARTDRGRYLTADTITVTTRLTSAGTAFPEGVLDLSIGREQIVETGVTLQNYWMGNSGLRGDSATAIYAGDDGRIWIGNTDGMALYLDLLGADRVTWRPLTLPVTLNNPTLIQGIARDGQGQTWVATDGGVAMLDAAETTWTVFRAGDSPLPSDRVFALTSAMTDTVWFGTDNGAARRTPAGDWMTYTAANSGLLNDQVNAIAADSTGNVWLGTNGGLNQLTPAGDWFSYTVAGGHLENDQVQDIAVDANGDVWLATGGGVTVKKAGGGWQTFTAGNSSLSSNTPTDIVIDDIGRKWIGHGCQALDLLEEDNATWVQLLSMRPSCLYDLNASPNGDVWAAADSGDSERPKGAIRYFKTPWTSQTYQETTVYDHSDVDMLGNVWFLSNDTGTVERILPDGVTWESFSVPGSMWNFTDLACDSYGQTWISSNGYGVAVLKADNTWEIYDTGNSNLLSDEVKAIDGDADGNVWFATGQGINKLTPAGTWVSYTTGNSNLLYAYIHDLDIDASGNVWSVTGEHAGSYEKLSELTPAGDWFSYTLPSAVRKMALDNAGTPWLAATYDGVYTLVDGDWIHYTTANSGLRSNDVEVVAMAPDGSKWIGYGNWYMGYGEEGISVLSADGQTWSHFYAAYNDGGVFVRDISFTPAGDAWVSLYYYYHHGGDRAAPRKADGYPQAADKLQPFARDNRRLRASDPSELAIQGITQLYESWQLRRDSRWTRSVSAGLGSPDVFVDTASLEASALDATGRLILRGELTGTGQLIAADTYPFYVLDSDIRLSIATDRESYYPGQTLTAQGVLTNDSALSLPSQEITLTLGSRRIYAASTPVLAPGNAYTFSVTATLPIRTGYMPLTLRSPLAEVQMGVQVMSPSVEVSLDAPVFAGRAPFSVTLTLSNTTAAPAAAQVSIAGNAPEWVAIPPGGFTVAAQTVEITQTTLITAAVQSDRSETLSRRVTWGETVSMTLDAPTASSETGPALIPYTITNTGALAFAVPLTITLDGEVLVTDTPFLWPGQSRSDELHVNLTAGAHSITATTPYAHIVAGWTAYPPGATSIRLDAAQIPGRLAGRTPVTVTLTNAGPNAFSGSLVAQMPFYFSETAVDIANGESRVITTALDSRGAPAGGVYTATVEVWERGVALDRVEQAVNIPPAEWQVNVPHLVLTPGAITTVPLTIHNAGGIGAPYTLTLELDGLFSRQTYSWLDAGQTDVVSFTIALPDDLEARTGVGRYTINAVPTPFTYTVAGYQLDMSAALSSRVAAPGAAVTATLTFTDVSGLGQPLALRARLGGAGEPQTAPITFTNAISVSFVITAPEQDTLLSYGLYHPQGRSLLLDTLRLYVQNGAVRVYPDRDRYASGDTLSLTAVAGVTGVMTLQAQGISQTRALTPEVPAVWNAPLPDNLIAGTYHADYTFEPTDEPYGKITGQAAFDVEGDRVEIHRIFTKNRAGAQHVTLQLVSHTPLDNVTINARIVAPDGATMGNVTVTADLSAGIQWVELPQISFTQARAGLHRIECSLAQNGRELAYGWEGFDVAGATLLGIRPSSDYYLPGRPVALSVAALNDGSLPATLRVELNGVLAEELALTGAGYQTVNVNLGVLAEGVYTLTARLDDGVLPSGELAARVQVAAPAAHIAVSAPGGQDGWHTATPDVEVWADFSGGAAVYRWDESYAQAAPVGQIGVPADDGPHTLAAWVEVSGAGSGPVTTTLLRLDRAAPVVAANVETGTPVTLTLAATDGASGVSWIRYQAATGAWMTYTAPLVFAAVQTTTVLYQAQDQAGNRSLTDRVDVPPVTRPYGLALAAESAQQAGAPGATVAYALSVHNPGYAADRYTVAVAGNDWPAQSVSILGPVNRGQSAALVVAVDVPLDAVLGSAGAVTVTVASENDPTQIGTEILTTTAAVYAGVEMSTGRPGRSGAPGTQVSYRLRITNRGNVADTFELDLGQHAWPVSAPQTVGPLNPGQSADVAVAVTLPQNATPGAEETVTVAAVSQLDPDQSANVALVTTAACVPVASAGLTYWPLNPQVGETVFFSATTVAGASPVDFAWEFGDNQTAAGPYVSHVYANEGEYSISVTATNCGAACVATHSAVVNVGASVAGNVTIYGPATGTTGEPLTFNAVYSTTSAIMPVNYAWLPEPGAGQGTAWVTYTWATAGTYTLQVAAESGSVILTDEHTVVIETKKQHLYLPLILR
ncbi:MAG: PKD domain-containing protein [Anaerolineae bacterium]|nr:PKD domain-containing protein [Anaerolineae bacterium]